MCVVLVGEVSIDSRPFPKKGDSRLNYLTSTGRRNIFPFGPFHYATDYRAPRAPICTSPVQGLLADLGDHMLTRLCVVQLIPQQKAEGSERLQRSACAE